MVSMIKCSSRFGGGHGPVIVSIASSAYIVGFDPLGFAHAVKSFQVGHFTTHRPQMIHS